MKIPSAEQFWQFSAQHYARPGVAQACLQLQDEYGANVNLLLLLVMLEAQGLTTQASHFMPLLTSRLSMFEQWRALRRQLKPKLDNDDYLALLQHELNLERWQQQELLQQLALHPPSAGHGGLLDYLAQLPVPDPPLWQLKLTC
ncbi:TIGR02444 family protein [Oceanisphaera pacifica]|uniref:TIGR02444 family protein n=1 Tax=Oceanisphaera pacifica TaxID=2818389 RepID=UPI001FB103D0|nr:TIGR02444 family protein [Oceanisphaera pacifica]